MAVDVVADTASAAADFHSILHAAVAGIADIVVVVAGNTVVVDIAAGMRRPDGYCSNRSLGHHKLVAVELDRLEEDRFCYAIMKLIRFFDEQSIFQLTYLGDIFILKS